MRNLKKLFAVVVVIAVMLTTMIPAAFAEGTTTTAVSADAQACATIGMLLGGNDGVTLAYTQTQPARIQAAIMLLRLKGLEAEAQKATGDNFSDVTANWQKPYTAYLKAHPELGFKGIGNNKYDPNSYIDAKQYYSVLLTVLGYGADYDWSTVSAKATEVGLTKLDGVAKVKVDDIAAATVQALKLKIKGSDKTLIQDLIDKKVITLEQAQNAGIIAKELTATASQTGAKIITVTFNRPVTDAEKTAATFNVKNGAVAYTVTPTWADDKTSVKLAYTYNFFAGDYTVEVGGIKDALKVTVADEKVSKIAVTNDYLPLSDNFDITYKVYNQFSEEMSDVSNLVFSAYDATKAKGVIDSAASTFQVDLVANGAAKDDSIILTVTHNTGVTVSKTIQVKDVAAPKNLQFGTVAPLTGKTRITEGETGLKLPYTFTDQYGNAYKLPEITAANTDGSTATEPIGQVLFMTSDASVITPDSFAVDSDGNLTFAAAGDGTATITAIVPALGVSTGVVIKVEPTAALKTFTMSNPGKLVAVGDSVSIPYSAADTFGAAIAQKDFTQQSSVTIISSNNAVINPSADVSWNGKHELVVAPKAVGTVTLSSAVNGIVQNSITLDVKALAVPTKIVGLKDVPTLFQTAAAGTIEMKNLNVIDQYNRSIDLGTYGGSVYTVAIGYDGGTGAAVTLSGDAAIASSAESATLTGAAEGSEKLKFDLMKAGTATPLSTYKVTAKTLKDADIVGYSIDTIGTIYADAANTTGSTHAVTPKLLGKDAAGNAVTINQAIITAVTSSNTSIINVDGTAKNIWGLKAGTSTVSIWKGGDKLAEVSVTTSEEKPYATTAEFDAASYTVTVTAGATHTATITLTVKDQYGVAMTSPAGTWTSSDTAKATVSAGTVTAVAVGTSTVTFVTNTGKVATAEIVVNP